MGGPGTGLSSGQVPSGTPADPQYKYSTPMPPGIASPDRVETRLGTLKFVRRVPFDGGKNYRLACRRRYRCDLRDRRRSDDARGDHDSIGTSTLLDRSTLDTSVRRGPEFPLDKEDQSHE